MNKYKLKGAGRYYLDMFDEKDITISEYLPAGYYKIVDGQYIETDKKDTEGKYYEAEQLAEAAFNINEEDYDFEIYFPVENGKIEQEYLGLIKNVLANLPELDSYARSLSSKVDYEENLAYINLSKGGQNVHLHYFATTINTEWGVYFTFKKDGTWRYETLG